MSDRPAKSGFSPRGLGALVGGGLLAAVFIWLWECHPLVVIAAVAGLFALATLLLLGLGLLSPPRSPTAADRSRDAALLGLVVGLLTGSFISHEKRDDAPDC